MADDLSTSTPSSRPSLLFRILSHLQRWEFKKRKILRKKERKHAVDQEKKEERKHELDQEKKKEDKILTRKKRTETRS